MTDVHCHLSSGDPKVREFLVGRDAFGIHPWETLEKDSETVRAALTGLRASLLANPRAAVGEIGLDRLKEREISPLMREVFETQLALALELNRPVVLHGAKCWGQVVKTVEKYLRRAFLFHGFSRSDGLIPDIVRLGGYISVGPAILNDHAVNYRMLVKKIPLNRILVETDRTEGQSVNVGDVLCKLASVLGLSAEELERRTDENAEAFLND